MRLRPHSARQSHTKPLCRRRYGRAALYAKNDTNETSDELLIGARRPHVPQEFRLYKEEVLVRLEIQYDHIFRWANFTSNLGRYFAWGFPNVANTTTIIQTAPARGAYLAAFKGSEGKPLPPEQGGFQKRCARHAAVCCAPMQRPSTAKPPTAAPGS